MSCFCFNESGNKFQHVYERYFDENSGLTASGPVDKKKWETVRLRLVSGKGYAAAVALRADRDAGCILELIFDSGVRIENELYALANYIRTQGSKADMALVERMSQSKPQHNPALLACSVKPYPGDAFALKLIKAGASVNDIAD